jgi:hypothetical protein
VNQTNWGEVVLELWDFVIKEAWVRRWRLVASILALALASGLIVIIQSLNASTILRTHSAFRMQTCPKAISSGFLRPELKASTESILV